VAEWKFSRPHTRPGVVLRPRLFATLDRHGDAALTLITAPAGYGKTELLASWLESRPELSAAWVSLDAGEDDPTRFWTHVAHSVDRIRSGMARPAFARLRSGAAIEESIDELMNGVSTYAGRLVIAVDDLHHFSSSSRATSLAYAVDHLPKHVRIVATLRADPVVRLTRLRARGAVAEIRADELAFSVPDATELVVDRMGVRLRAADIAALVAHTEGWPAGISLAGLWLAEVEEPADELLSFSGDHRQIADYLTDEVLYALDDETRSFMARTSLLDRLSGPLCDALLETTGSAQRLEALAHSVLFLLPLDRRGEWYRYHQLFRDLLMLELSREGPDVAAELHRRATKWFAEHDLLEEALEHAGATGDADEVAQLLGREYVNLSRRGGFETLIRWALWLPDERLRLYPDVCGAAALAAAVLGRPADEVQRLLHIADSSALTKPAEVQLRVGAITSVTRAVSIVDGLERAVASARSAVRLALEDGDELVVGALGALAYVLYLVGELDEAADVVHQALARPEAPQRPQGFVAVMACAALIEHDRGHVHIAEAEARRALEHARHLGLGGIWVAGLARLAMGQALLGTGAFAEAERHLERAERLRRAAQPALEHIHALLVLAEARISRGRLPLAADELALALEGLDAIPDAGRLPGFAQRVKGLLEEALARANGPVEPPTPAELAVLKLLATDLSKRQIAQELFVSPNTVKTHSRNLYRKLGASSRTEVVRRAGEVGLLG
jgi:LuxR family transcriptional regulator, maltose regulon positive regulatory protein